MSNPSTDHFHSEWSFPESFPNHQLALYVCDPVHGRYCSSQNRVKIRAPLPQMDFLQAGCQQLKVILSATQSENCFDFFIVSYPLSRKIFFILSIFCILIDFTSQEEYIQRFRLYCHIQRARNRRQIIIISLNGD